MIVELEDLVAAFPGEANWTRCFTHIINLVAKSILQQFDMPKVRDGEGVDKSESMRELVKLARDIKFEEKVSQGLGEEGEEDDDVDGLEDEREGLSEADRQALNEDIEPICQVLVKVRMSH